MFDALSSDSVPRLLYLVLLGLAVLVGVGAAYRGRRASGLRDAAVWALIFLGFVAAYGLRDDIGSALSPRVAAVSDAGDLVLRRGPDGHFHVQAEVNGAPVTFLVDTGASGVVLNAADARRAGFELSDLRFTSRARTANGEVRLAPVRVDRLALGPVAATGVRASVSEGELFSSLLGMSFLDRFARVTVEGDRMYLTP
ncbi:MAG: TIGR02281 family clan AA aspartic protease [Pseudomonadota bacterium]|nr:TIGR02281 family clan AA aspartic protease [Pseudomonadota bacterium]